MALRFTSKHDAAAIGRDEPQQDPRRLQFGPTPRNESPPDDDYIDEPPRPQPRYRPQRRSYQQDYPQPQQQIPPQYPRQQAQKAKMPTWKAVSVILVVGTLASLVAAVYFLAVSTATLAQQHAIISLCMASTMAGLSSVSAISGATKGAGE